MTSFFSSILVLSLASSIAIVTNAETVKAASPDGSFTMAQTSGMERRQDRRDTRQDCRQQEGIVGGDKRDCKQEGRQDGDKTNNDKTTTDDTK